MTTNNDQAPANQDTPPNDNGQKLLAGKFKTPEELEAAYQEATRGFSQVSEENNRLNRYISLMDAAPPQSNGTPGYVSVDQGEETEEAKFRRIAREEANAVRAQVQQGADLEKQFFEKYDDLKGQDKLVLICTTELRQELNSMGKRMPVPMFMEEVAARTRAELRKIRGDQNTPPHVQGGSQTGPNPPRRGPSEELSEEQRTQDAINERRKLKLQRMSRKG